MSSLIDQHKNSSSSHVQILLTLPRVSHLAISSFLTISLRTTAKSAAADINILQLFIPRCLLEESDLSFVPGMNSTPKMLPSWEVLNVSTCSPSMFHSISRWSSDPEASNLETQKSEYVHTGNSRPRCIPLERIYTSFVTLHSFVDVDLAGNVRVVDTVISILLMIVSDLSISQIRQHSLHLVLSHI